VNLSGCGANLVLFGIGVPHRMRYGELVSESNCSLRPAHATASMVAIGNPGLKQLAQTVRDKLKTVIAAL
jgi:hypothetical protein